MRCIQRAALVALAFAALLCSAPAERVLKQAGRQQETLPEDVQLPEFTCDFQGQFPYIASIRDGTEDKEHICGGVIIAKDAVLTAAHCVDTRTSNKATTTPTVHLGGASSDVPVEVRKTRRAFPHPKWAATTEDGHDLVILKLDRPTCLLPIHRLGAPQAEDRNELPFLGFGRTAIGGSFSFILQAGLFNSLNSTHCNERYNINPPLGRKDLCVRAQTTIGVCSGDDGGPLVYQPTFTVFRDVLIGIASYTTDECTSTEGASVFMDIHKYRRWIKKTLRSEEFKKA